MRLYNGGARRRSGEPKKLTRQQVLDAIKVHAYHGRTDEALRLYVSHRVSYTAYQEALRFGVNAKAAGVGCSCADCRPET